VFDSLLPKLDATRGLIIDLRYNGGGSEPLALEISGCFLDEERTYAMTQYRNGPDHDDLSPAHSQRCRPRDPLRYAGPVVVLQGQRTMSSAESFVLMLSQCPQVVTMGDRTAGSSGNPRQLDAGQGITVNLPRWNHLDASGKPFDAIGISPDVTIEAAQEEFTDERDPVLTAALERLRSVDPTEVEVLQLRPGAVRSEERPQVVKVSPAMGATDVDPVTEVRIRFDQPMNPAEFFLEWTAARNEVLPEPGFRMRAEAYYDADKYEFTFPVTLTSGSMHRLQLPEERLIAGSSLFKNFRSLQGSAAAPHRWHFQTRGATGDVAAPASQVTAIDPPATSRVSAFTSHADQVRSPGLT
jgi:hypothetical protein